MSTVMTLMLADNFLCQSFKHERVSSFSAPKYWEEQVNNVTVIAASNKDKKGCSFKPMMPLTTTTTPTNKMYKGSVKIAICNR